MNTMKQLLTITGSALIIASCQEPGKQQNIAADSMVTREPVTDNTYTQVTTDKYVDLRTNQPVDLYYDENKKRTYSATTNEPVDFYVNVATGDTVYGQGRYVVNNYIEKLSDGKYQLDDDKVKMSNGELKIKSGDQKLKIDEGEMKMKDDDNKYKADDRDTKMKTETEKIKTDDGETKRKNE